VGSSQPYDFVSAVSTARPPAQQESAALTWLVWPSVLGEALSSIAPA